MLLLTTYYGKDTYIDGKTSYSLEGLQYATNLNDSLAQQQLERTVWQLL